uniref:hypothetical protein n=1 Tax=Bacteroides fragilis TaxID=817 RepID=UPI003569A78B
MKETTFQKIIRRTGRKPVECKCQACVNQCRTPCLGTPEDIMRLIEAGYTSKLAVTGWSVGLVLGRIDRIIPMVQPLKADNGFCVFHKDGLCELHDLGLKPTEGRLSHHSIKADNTNFRKSLSYNVAKEWEDPENRELIDKITFRVLFQ